MKRRPCYYTTAKTADRPAEPTATGVRDVCESTSRRLRTMMASSRRSSTLCCEPEKLVTRTFLLADMLAHAGTVLFTFFTLVFSYL